MVILAEPRPGSAAAGVELGKGGPDAIPDVNQGQIGITLARTRGNSVHRVRNS